MEITEELKPIERAHLARIDKVLSKEILSGGRVITRREWISNKIAGGYLPKEYSVIDTAALEKAQRELKIIKNEYLLIPNNPKAGSNPNLPRVQKGYELIERIKNNEYKKAIYRLMNGDIGYDISKIEYDYGISI